VWHKIKVQIFACMYLIFLTLFVEETTLSLLNGLGILVKNHVTLNAVVYLSEVFNLYVCLYGSTTLFLLPQVVISFEIRT
jgi:hypothetical protein